MSKRVKSSVALVSGWPFPLSSPINPPRKPPSNTKGSGSKPHCPLPTLPKAVLPSSCLAQDSPAAPATPETINMAASAGLTFHQPKSFRTFSHSLQLPSTTFACVHLTPPPLRKPSLAPVIRFCVSSSPHNQSPLSPSQPQSQKVVRFSLTEISSTYISEARQLPPTFGSLTQPRLTHRTRHYRRHRSRSSLLSLATVVIVVYESIINRPR